MPEKTLPKTTFCPGAVPAVSKNTTGKACPKSTEDLTRDLERTFGQQVLLSAELPKTGDSFVIIESQRIFDVIQYLRDDEEYACTVLQTIAAVDYPANEAAASVQKKSPEKAQAQNYNEQVETPHNLELERFKREGRIELVYFLWSYAHRHQLTLKVFLKRDSPSVKSITRLYRAANWYERECFDLLGVNFVGHPNLKRILLPQDWNAHPLRRDYEFPEEYNGMKVPL